MKTIKLLTLLFSIIFVVSCSKDDDNTPQQPEVGYFPVKINRIYYGENGSITYSYSLDYNADNQITKISFLNSDDVIVSETNYEYENQLLKKAISISYSGNQFETVYDMNHSSEDILTSIALSFSGVPYPVFPVLYDESTNTYSISDAWEFILSNDNALKYFSKNQWVVDITVDPNKSGIFKYVNLQPAFLSQQVIENNVITDICLFNPVEVTSYTIKDINNGDLRNIIVSSSFNTNGMPEAINHSNTIDSWVIQYTIEYEEREL